MTMFELFSLLGGVGLFLYGMTVMSVGLKNACGEKLRTILEKATKNRGIAVLVGTAITMLIQSSSATDVMVIGFVNSGLMTLEQSIGVIMGANIGTTVTAQITAFPISAYAPVLLFVGAVMYLFFKKNMVKYVGCVMMGFGMLFQGITLMKSAIAPLAQTPAFIALVSNLANPVVTVLFGVAFTALLQSSSSSTVIFQAFAVEGIISYEIAVYLCIGAAIGSVTPNIIASFTTNRDGKRTALLNLLFNLFRAALLMTILAVFPGVLNLIRSLSPGDIGRQVANTHTIFALFSVLTMLPFTRVIVGITRKLLPPGAEEVSQAEDRKLVYMVRTDMVPPAVAMDQAHREIVRMGAIARDNLARAIEHFFEKNEEKAAAVLETEETVNYLERAILSKLVELRTLDVSQRDMTRVYHMALVVSDIERLSDHAENITEYALQVHSGKAVLSEEAKAELKTLAELTLRSVDTSLAVFAAEDHARLWEAEELEEQVDAFQEEIIQKHIQRLMCAHCDPLGGVVFDDMVTDLERCSDHAINIAAALFAQTA